MGFTNLTMWLRLPNRGPRLKALVPQKRADLLPSVAKLFPLPRLRPLPETGKTLTLTRPMGSQGEELQENPTKRPFCHRCSKPLRLCLCSRLKTPPLDNSIGITILQHSLEKHHPLNSTRVARLGFKNVAVVPVTDVNFTAQFSIRPIPQNRVDSGERSDFSKTHMADLDDNRVADGECGNVDFVKDSRKYRKLFKKSKSIEIQNGVVEAIFDKYRVSCSFNDVRVVIERTVEPDIRWVLETPVGRALASNGFTVSKLQRKQLPNSEEFQDFEEFNIVMPQGAVLLFPGKWAMGLDEVDFEVKHLVVLDGTWAKARRMYHENPWLTLLPHVKLDLGKESLYSEVRHQPKAGCLSTIESIIYALKGLGNEMEGLDELLDLFELMIGDQRRCKDENFGTKAMS